MKRHHTAEAEALTKRRGILRRRPNLRLIPTRPAPITPMLRPVLRLDAHEASTHNTDAGARQGAANAQTAIEEHIPLDTVHGIPAVAARVLALENAAPAGGGAPTVLFDGSFVASTDMGKITGDIVCPETGDVELYARSTSGDRPGWSGYMKLPAADLRAATGAAGTAIANTSTNKVSGGVGRQQRYGLCRGCH